jgi:hypothetical protein
MTQTLYAYMNKIKIKKKKKRNGEARRAIHDSPTC